MAKSLEQRLIEAADEEKHFYQDISHEDLLREAAKEIISLNESLKWLTALENAGVDNWSGISFAYELLEEME